MYFDRDIVTILRLILYQINNAYAFSHYITQKFWQDLKSDDIHWTLTDTGWAKAAWGLNNNNYFI